MQDLECFLHLHLIGYFLFLSDFFYKKNDLSISSYFGMFSITFQMILVRLDDVSHFSISSIRVKLSSLILVWLLLI